MDRVRPLDASFLHVEDEVHHLHLGSVAVLEGPMPTQGEIAGMVAGRLPLLPRYRQRLRAVPWGLGRPIWAADPHFSLDYHLRVTGLPSPGGSAQLRALVSRVMSQKLDRNKPLWELWAIEGLEDGRWALLSKAHHAMIDGVTGNDLLGVLLDRDPEPSPPVPDTWRPGDDPSGARLLGETLLDYLASPFEQWRVLRAAGLRPARLALAATDRARAAIAARTAPDGSSASSLTGPIGPHRAYAWAHADLRDVYAIRRAFGGTVHDVVLAAVAGGFRTWLHARRDAPSSEAVQALTPVSVRHARDRGTYNNGVVAPLVALPLHPADPVQRLRAVQARSQPFTGRTEPVEAWSLASLTGFAAPLLLALGTRVVVREASRMRPPAFETVVTNVPGPIEPLYAMGRRMVACYPYAPLVGRSRVGVAVFSYVGELAIGFTSDRDAIPDVDVLAHGTERGLAELVEVSQPRPVSLRLER